MTWIQTLGGAAVDLRCPSPETLDIEEIATSLSRLTRFTGHAREFYSVAQHSCLVSEYLRVYHSSEQEPLALAGLLHDAHEAYFGDITSPVKELLGSQYLHAVVWGFDQVLEAKFLPPHNYGPELLLRHPLVKGADRVLLATERRDLMSHCERPWELDLPRPSVWQIHPWGMEESRENFLKRFKHLSAANLQQVGK